MARERTLTIIKPDAVEKGATGAILARLAEEGFTLVALRQRWLARREVEGFYHVHRGKPFFDELVEFMSSGPCMPVVLERDNAIAHLREVMGATDPSNADEGTLRKQYATDIGQNAVHGSDAPETAAFEIGYFFAGVELSGGAGSP